MKTLELTRFAGLDYSCNEALNTLCTNLSFAGSNVKKIMMTSCHAQEGKSFLTMALMRSLANIGKNVVLVDADLRRSMLASRYGVKTDGKPLGLTHYLAGMCPMDDILYKTNIEGAYMILSGRDVANSLTLLSTERFPNLLDALSKMFDVVLVDCPPVGVIIDAAQIAKSCDGVVFVVSNDSVTRRELADARHQIEKTGCPILGAVLNKVTFDTHSSKKYYYKTYYNHYADGYYESSQTKIRRASAPAKSKGLKGTSAK